MLKMLRNEDWLTVFTGFVLTFFILLSGLYISPKLSWNNFADLGEVLSISNFIQLISLAVVFLVALAFIAFTQKKNIIQALKGGLSLIFLAFIAFILSGNTTFKDLGLEFVLFALFIGLLIKNTFGTPDWIKPALQSEFYVKIGLVIMGTTVLFKDILQAGSLGLLQALAVVLSVWYFSYWLCKRLKLDEELTFMLSSAVSICGVSAAIATAGAIQGNSKKLSYVISLVMVTAIPMMLLMPYAAQSIGLSENVIGAWLGGTIDTTGAVVVSGSIAGESALKISTIVKFSQNVLLGLAAFAISVYWTTKNTSEQENQSKVDLKSIWERFPKFVLGFIVISLVFSFGLSPDTIKANKDTLKTIQQLWFALSFVCIGLETDFKDFVQKDYRTATYAFLGAQTFNIIITLIIASFLFG